MTALAQPAKQVAVQADPAATGEGAPGLVPLGHAISPTPEPAPPKRSPAHYLWAVLIARILTHLGLAAQPPPRAPAVRLDLFQAA